MSEQQGFVPLNANDFVDKNKSTEEEPQVQTQDETNGSGFVRLADSKQPKDIFAQLDSTVRDISAKFSREPYMASAYRSALSTMPGLDPVTKEQLAQGDTTNLKEAYGIPAAHYLNQYLFNYPRAIAAKMGMEYPEAETAAGNVLAKTAGIAGGLTQLQGGTKLASKIPGLGKTGSLAGPDKILNAARSMAKGGVAGGAQGALISPEDMLDWKARGQQALVGFGIGMVLAPLSDKISNWIRKKSIRGKSTPKGRIARKRADIDYDNSVKDIESQTFIKEADDLLGQSQKELQDTIATQQVRGKVPELKSSSVKHGKQVNRVYDHTVNRISREIEDNTTSHGSVDHFTSFLDDLRADEGLKNTSAFGRVTKFVDDIIEEGDTLTFKQINDMRHGIVKGKAYRGDMDDVVYTQFRNSFNRWAETVDTTGKFKQLNAGMAPRLDFKAAFNKKLNTYKKYETSGGEKLVQKYANRNVDPKGITQGEIDLMDDAMKYFNKYGVTIDDIESLYSGKAKDLAKVTSVTEKLSKLEGAESKLAKIASEKGTQIRTKQNVTVDEIMTKKSLRVVGSIINTVIRLSLASMALNTLGSIKEGLGMSSGASNQPVN